MNFYDWLLTWPKEELAKSLAQHAKENAALKNEVDRLKHEVFWLRVVERNPQEESL